MDKLLIIAIVMMMLCLWMLYDISSTAKSKISLCATDPFKYMVSELSHQNNNASVECACSFNGINALTFDKEGAIFNGQQKKNIYNLSE